MIILACGTARVDRYALLFQDARWMMVAHDLYKHHAPESESYSVEFDIRFGSWILDSKVCGVAQLARPFVSKRPPWSTFQLQPVQSLQLLLILGGLLGIPTTVNPIRHSLPSVTTKRHVQAKVQLIGRMPRCYEYYAVIRKAFLRR